MLGKWGGGGGGEEREWEEEKNLKLQYDENRQQYAGRGRRERATHQVHNMRREGRGWGVGGKG